MMGNRKKGKTSILTPHIGYPRNTPFLVYYFPPHSVKTWLFPINPFIGDKKMFEKYIMIKDTKVTCKQTSTGIWYCSELPADDVKSMDALIGEMNKILNKYNKGKNESKSNK